VGRHPVINTRRCPFRSRREEGGRRSEGQGTENDRYARATGVERALSADEMPRGQAILIGHAGEELRSAFALDRHGVKTVSPVPSQEHREGDLAEPAVAVVQNDQIALSVLAHRHMMKPARLSRSKP